MIEYVDIPIEWQKSESLTYVLNAFRRGCVQASKLSILDLYLDLGFSKFVSFTDFIEQLTYDKKQPNACPFDLVDDDSHLTDEEIMDRLKDTKWNDTLSSINKAFDKMSNLTSFTKWAQLEK